MPKTTITPLRAASLVSVLAACLAVLAMAADRGPAARAAAAEGGTPATAAACSRAVLVRRKATLARFRATMAPRRRAFFRTHPRLATRRAYVRRQAATLRALRRAVAACAPRPAPPKPPGPPQKLPFYPQAGLLWQDLLTTNYLDLDAGAGIRDFECGRRSYDTHTGHDTIIRSFREQDIGVPVFAALDGTVAEVQVVSPDYSYGSDTQPFDNHVVIDHGNQQQTVYGHLRRASVKVRVGQRVTAGTQIGLTGSSGNSSWPHLHFTVRYRAEPYEPSTGPCNPGASGWVEQVPTRRELYANDLAVSAQPFEADADLPWDRAVRTGTFVAGVRDVYVRVELSNLPDEALDGRMRLLRPDGSVAFDDPSPPTAAGYHRGSDKRHARVDLDRLGRWTLAYEAGDVRFDAPLEVVATPADVVNRPPAPVAVSFWPAAPAATDVVFCRVATSLVGEDPDTDIVSYRYRWTVDGSPVREVTSAALSDAIPKGTARPGQEIRCSVTPTDGTLPGPGATAAVTAR